jgi:hypothetical protein
MATAAISLSGADWTDFFARLGLDLAAVLAVAGGSYLRRHYRRDLFLVFVTFNLGVFCVLEIITEKKISAAVGFGLFALLSIIRLRSEPFGNVELGYVFASLVLGVVNGIGHGGIWLKLVVDAIIVTAVFVLDHPRLQTPIQRRRVELDAVHTDTEALRAELERRFGVKIVELVISQVDYVRETTSASIRYIERSPRPSSSLFALEDELGTD